MNITPDTNKKLSIDSELDEHMPKAFQTMLKIEQMAQERFRQIEESIKRGETTLEAVKRDRGLL
ncbi:hypothetical protein [Methanosarcina sp. UBA5]|uniref:hypothetical protein n=1 Tax=Methanosarcina sp. UBA5 TaxID=1915593 RepID=UPI0025D253D2|nr:hypothetical protein [Methanosarcina sp. UBA5]